MALSHLQRAVGSLLDQSFPHLTIYENKRPDWLISSQGTRLELDYFIPELSIAFEVQGRQHYEYIERFHQTPEDFENQKRRDAEKADICYGRGVRLYQIVAIMDALIAVKDIEELLGIIPVPTKFTYIPAGPPGPPGPPGGQRRRKIPKVPLYGETDLLVIRRYRDIYARSDEETLGWANTEDKLKEVKQIRSKFGKFFSAMKPDDEKKIPWFGFRVLTVNEGCSVLDEFNMPRRMDQREAEIAAIRAA